MKKLLIILAIFIAILSFNKHEKVTVPKEIIRFRVIANSNEEKDQQEKKEVVKNLSTILKETNQYQNIDKTREYVIDKLPTFEEIVDKTLDKTDLNHSFHINYGKNYFPKKEYKNLVFEEGEYESLVVTIGEGKGDNFWCILFPPLCFIEEDENIEYHSFIKEIFAKYF